MEAAAGDRPVRRRAELCAEHVGGTVQRLTTWANDRGLRGEVTVLAIDQPAGDQAAPPGGADRVRVQHDPADRMKKPEKKIILRGVAVPNDVQFPGRPAWGALG